MGSKLSTFEKFEYYVKKGKIEIFQREMLKLKGEEAYQLLNHISNKISYPKSETFFCALLTHPEIDTNRIFRNENYYPWLRCSVNILHLMSQKSFTDHHLFDSLPLRYAVDYGNVNLVEKCLADIRVEPTCFNHICLKKAISNSNIEIIKLLLADKRINLDSNLSSVFDEYWVTRRFDVLKLLLDDSRIKPNFGIIIKKLVNYDNKILDLIISHPDFKVEVYGYDLFEKLYYIENSFEFMEKCFEKGLIMQDRYFDKACVIGNLSLFNYFTKKFSLQFNKQHLMNICSMKRDYRVKPIAHEKENKLEMARQVFAQELTPDFDHLHTACHSDFLEMMILILSVNPKIYIKDRDNLLFKHAYRSRYLDILEYLNKIISE